jgi:hypothetical protein
MLKVGMIERQANSGQQFSAASKRQFGALKLSLHLRDALLQGLPVRTGHAACPRALASAFRAGSHSGH